MTFLRPNISDIAERVQGDLRAGLSLKAILRRSLTGSLGRALTGASHELHGRASYIAEQLFVDTMADEYLDRYAAVYALPRKVPTYAKLNVTFTGDPGYSIPAGSEVARSDTFVYTTDAIYEIQTATPAVAEITNITTVGDFSSSLNSKYFFLSSPTTDYYIWLNVGGAGVDPAISGRTGIAVALLANDPSTTVANKVRITINNMTDFDAAVTGSVVTVTAVATGAATNPADVSTGFTFAVTTEGVDAVVGGQVTGVITASSAGTDGNAAVGDEMSLSSTIFGVDSAVIVASVNTEGEDVETDDAYRARIIDRVQQPPHGGDANDWEEWALAVPGVTRAWILPDQMGAGTVLVWVVQDDETSIFPGQAKLDEVKAYILAQRPVTAGVYVASPSPVDLNITVKIKPYNQDVRDAITAELQDMILRDAVPQGALKNAGTATQYDGKILLSHIHEAISIAAGEFDHEIVSPTTNAPATTGQMYRLGTVTFLGLA